MLSGSFVVAGSGLYRATRVGRDAYAAQLAEEASRFTLVNSELRNGIDRILRFITWLLVPAGALSIYNQLSGNQPLREALRGMVAALVPMVPEGLVLMTAIAFAVGVVRLGRQQLPGQRAARDRGAGPGRRRLRRQDRHPDRERHGAQPRSVRSAAAGGPVDEALAALAAADPRPNASLQAIGDAYPDDPGWTLEVAAPFSSARKWSGATFADHGSWVLGAPTCCSAPTTRRAVEAERIGTQGLRVLLLGRVAHPVDASTRPAGTSSRPPWSCWTRGPAPTRSRPCEYFARQQVTVKVISGDNARSVGAVARSLDLPGADDAVDARDLPEDADRAGRTMEHTSVFGRVTPDQKRSMVHALQASGHTVAMTGDGVNDVLALKDADIGVAMGSGSPATRAVAQIVLLDNSFATLPRVVAEGRRVIGNIERVSTLFLTKTVYSALLALMVGVPGLIGRDPLPYPFFPRHVTITGWFTIGVPAFLLALAPNEERARRRFRPPGDAAGRALGRGRCRSAASCRTCSHTRATLWQPARRRPRRARVR